MTEYKINLNSTGGYSIPCIHTISGKDDLVCIISHGFGSSKESPTAQMMLEELSDGCIGAIAFDWPCHGESKAKDSDFRVSRCLDDLEAVESFVRETSPNAEIVYFSSSFGAYINLIYISHRPHLGTKSFLRSAAVNMPVLFESISAEEEAELRERGYCTVDYDYVRPLNITQGFLDDLKKYDLFKVYKQGDVNVRMIHGDEDETISVLAAKQFATQFDIPITIVPGGDHRLSSKETISKVISESKALYAHHKFKQ
jgi:pimeloyl-ACP methyl ester carboxylesterase